MPLSRKPFDPFAAFALAVLFAVLLPLEVACVFLSWHTLGDSATVVLTLAIGLNGLPVVFLVLGWRRAALVLALVIGLAIIPYQLALGWRWAMLQEESARIVTWAYRERLLTGEFPPDLSGYTFARPELSRYIQKYQGGKGPGDLFLVYRIGTVNTSHWYGEGGWGYYPD